MEVRLRSIPLIRLSDFALETDFKISLSPGVRFGLIPLKFRFSNGLLLDLSSIGFSKETSRIELSLIVTEPSSFKESIIPEMIPKRIKNITIIESTNPTIEANMNLKNCFIRFVYLFNVQM